MSTLTDTSLSIDILSLICFTILFGISILFYAIYMIAAVLKKGSVDTPDEKTFRFGFLVVIIVALAFLAFGLQDKLSEGVLALIGTLAGYVLGGVRLKKKEE